MQIRNENIPAELKAAPQWINWKHHNGKKPPIAPATGKRADVTDSGACATFDFALRKAESDARLGVGFVLTDDGRIIGIDLDDCVTDGQIAPWAMTIVVALGSYAELSPSGTGIRIFLRGSIPAGLKPLKAKIPTSIIPADQPGLIEIYGFSRYLTVTGNILPDAPRQIADANEAFDRLYTALAAPQAEQAQLAAPQAEQAQLAAPQATSSASKRQRAYHEGFAKNRVNEAVTALQNAVDGELHNTRIKYARLLGGLIPHGLITESEAADIIYNARPPRTNVGQEINAIYAGLHYGQDAPLELPEPPANEPALVRSGGEHQRPPAPASKSGHELASANDDAGDPDSIIKSAKIRETDTGNARRMVALYGDEVKHCGAFGWVAWNGRYWEIDSEERAYQAAQKMVQSIYREALEADDQDRRAALGKHALACESAGRQESALKLYRRQPEVAVKPGIFDQQSTAYLLTCGNGTINLKTGELLPFSKENYLTKGIATNYDPNAECPRWHQFMRRIFADNTAVIDFMQRVCGEMLLGINYTHSFYIGHGSGRNGKGTFLEVLGKLLGDYADTIEVSSLMHVEPGKVRDDLASLAGKRMVTLSEVSKKHNLSSTIIKMMSGGDKIKARHLYQKAFEYKVGFNLFMITNERPVIDMDYAMSERVKLIPFTVTIPESERNPNLSAELVEELPGILAWTVRGCLELQRSGLNPPAEVKAATEEYREQMDTLGQFLKEATIEGKRYEVPAKQIYSAYESWCNEIGERPMANQRFSESMISRGFKREHQRIGNVYLGLALLSTRNDAPTSYATDYVPAPASEPEPEQDTIEMCDCEPAHGYTITSRPGRVYVLEYAGQQIGKYTSLAEACDASYSHAPQPQAEQAQPQAEQAQPQAEQAQLTEQAQPQADLDYVRKCYAARNYEAIRIHCTITKSDYDKVLVEARKR